MCTGSPSAALPLPLPLLRCLSDGFKAKAAVATALAESPSPASTCSTHVPRPFEEVDVLDVAHWVEMPLRIAASDEDGIVCLHVAGIIPEQLVDSISAAAFHWTTFAAAGLSSCSHDAPCCASRRKGGSCSSSACSKALLDFADEKETGARRRRTAENVMSVTSPRDAAGPLGSPFRLCRLLGMLALSPLAFFIMIVGACGLGVGATVSMLLSSLVHPVQPQLAASRTNAAQAPAQRRELLQSASCPQPCLLKRASRRSSASPPRGSTPQGRPLSRSCGAHVPRHFSL